MNLLEGLGDSSVVLFALFGIYPNSRRELVHTEGLYSGPDRVRCTKIVILPRKVCVEENGIGRLKL